MSDVNNQEDQISGLIEIIRREETAPRYLIEKYTKIFQQDKYFSILVKEHDISNLKVRELIEILTENRTQIINNTIFDLMSSSFLRQEIASLFELDFLTQKFYRQIFYTFKYSTLKNFFKENRKNFIPEFDLLNIEKSEQMDLFVKSMFVEMDRFADIIDDIYNIPDIDSVPDEYLNYLSQLVGYEREDRDILGNLSFRELIKNIIEIYRIKGTGFSFELFFRFLGFDAEVREFWFDKRFIESNISSNDFSGVSREEALQSHVFFLTTIKPTDYFPEGSEERVVVSENEIVETLDLRLFDNMLSEGEYTLEQLLGISPGYPDTPYTYFKTNVVQFYLEPIHLEDDDDIEILITADAFAAILRYANFLIPIFLMRRIIFLTRPEIEFWEDFNLSDLTRPNLNYPKQEINSERMFRTNIGKKPIKYNFADGTAYDGTPNDFNEGDVRWTGPYNLEAGGYFISGLYNDTFQKIWDFEEDSGSIFEKIKKENGWGFNKTKEYISNLISSGNLFNIYPEVMDRDLFYPILDLLVSRFSAVFDDLFNDGYVYFGSNYSLMHGIRKENFNLLENYAKIEIQKIENGNVFLEQNMNSVKALIPENQSFLELKGQYSRNSFSINNINFLNSFADLWQSNFFYEVGDYVRDGSENFYVCTVEHSSEGQVGIGVGISLGYWASLSPTFFIQTGDSILHNKIGKKTIILGNNSPQSGIFISSSLPYSFTKGQEEINFFVSKNEDGIIYINNINNKDEVGYYSIIEKIINNNSVELVLNKKLQDQNLDGGEVIFTNRFRTLNKTQKNYFMEDLIKITEE